jgi:hypothetical protein
LAFIAGLPAGLAFGFIQRPAFAQAFGFGQPGQGFIFFHLLQNRCCITRSYLLQRVISKGNTDMATQHLKEIAQRLVNAEANFVSTLMELGGVDAAAAEKVFGLYKKHKLIKLDAFHGIYSVKHGAFLDRKTIKNAAAS